MFVSQAIGKYEIAGTMQGVVTTARIIDEIVPAMCERAESLDILGVRRGKIVSTYHW